MTNSAIKTPGESGLGENDTAVVATEDQNRPTTITDIDRLPSLSSVELPGGNEPGYYIVAADDIDPAQDRGLTESLARMSLEPSTTTMKTDIMTTSLIKKDSPKTTTAITAATTTTTTSPPASSEDSLKMEDDYPQGSLGLTMDQSWLASAPPSSVCDELLGRSVTNMGIYKSPINAQPYKPQVKELTPSRRWHMVELLMRAFFQLKRQLPLSSFGENDLVSEYERRHL